MANTYGNGFYSLMEQAGISNKDSFDAYLKDVIGANNSTELKLDGFVWENNMQLDFDYKQLQIENRVGVMATYLDKIQKQSHWGQKALKLQKVVFQDKRLVILWMKMIIENILSW